MYPLFSDRMDKIGGEIHNFDGTYVEITCIEGRRRYTKYLEVVESRLYDIILQK